MDLSMNMIENILPILQITMVLQEFLKQDHNDAVDLITKKNIVALFQGKSEAGPRALGNRSIMYDPRDPKGKDHVNTIKRREYFRPFAGSILKKMCMNGLIFVVWMRLLS